jgi:hypothetical protein
VAPIYSDADDDVHGEADESEDVRGELRGLWLAAAKA